MQEFYFPISVKDQSKLKMMSDAIVDYLKENKAATVEDVSFTLCVGREHYRYRRIVKAKSLNELIELLANSDSYDSQDTVEYRYMVGEDISWESFFENINAKIVDIPVYEFSLKGLADSSDALIESNVDPIEKLETLGYQAILVALYSICNNAKNMEDLLLNPDMFAKKYISNSYLSLLKAWKEELHHAGYIGDYGLTDKAKQILLDETLESTLHSIDRFIQKYSGYVAFGSLLRIFVENYIAILTGDMDPKELLVQKGERFFDVYANNPISNTLNNIMAEAVLKVVHERKDNVNILEVGAGTCATTLSVLSKLSSCDNWHYCCSDISTYLVNKAAERIKNPLVSMAVVDVSKDNEEYAGSFDIIIATNVLHAVADIKNAIRNLHKMLNKGGMLILGEITRKRSFLTQTFGIFHDWWNGDGDSFRESNSPVLSLSSWEKLLVEHEFLLEQTESVYSANWQSLIVAKKKTVASEYRANMNNNVRVTTEKLSEIVAKVSGQKNFSIDANFADYGVDSLMIVALTGEINRCLGTSMKTTQLFDYPTIRKLADYINTMHSAAKHSNNECSKNDVLKILLHINAHDFALRNHKVNGRPMVPLDEFVNLVLEHTKKYDMVSECRVITDFKILTPIFVDDGVELELVIEKHSGNVFSSAIYRTKDNQECVCTFTLSKLEEAGIKKSYDSPCLEFGVSTDELFSLKISEIGNECKCIQTIRYSDDGFSCDFDQNKIRTKTQPLNNVVISCLMFPYFVCNDKKCVYLPFSFERLEYEDVANIKSCKAFCTSSYKTEYVFDLFLYNNSGKPVLEIYGLKIKEWRNLADFEDVRSETISEKRFMYEQIMNDPLNSVKLAPSETQDLDTYSDAIAIIGYSGKFGATNSIDEYYDALLKGKSFIRKLPESRKAFWIGDENVQGGFLNCIDEFDNEFFEMSLQESEYTEPQQRLFLQEAWHAFENAGITEKYMRDHRSKIGIFVGACSGDYSMYIDKVSGEKKPQTFWGTSASLLSARVSYFFDLNGPSMTLDTACSSSLVALHQACESLRSGECVVALAGGVFCMTTDEFFRLGKDAGMLSKDSKCYTFDERANGFVPGESVSAYVLKPLHLAKKDNDNILALIVATGVNQDGRTNTITAPSANSQTNLIQSIYKKYNINPERIIMAEAHGTGTSLGDPIEFRALNDAFSIFTSKKHYCYLGSVKTNLGHSAGGAGLAGLGKVVASLKNGVIAKTINYQRINPIIEIDNSPFVICEKNKFIQDYEEPLLATVSAFGFGGTNAHAVIARYNDSKSNVRDEKNNIYPIVISAKSEYSLLMMLKNLEESVRDHLHNIPLSSLAYTLACRRNQLSYRIAFSASSMDELASKLALINSKRAKVYCNQTIMEDFNEQSIFSRAICDDFGRFSDVIKSYIESDYTVIFDESLFENKIVLGDLPAYQFEHKSIWVEKNIDFNKCMAECLNNHIVGGSSILPFMCALYWACGSKSNFGLENCVLYKPVRSSDLQSADVKRLGTDIGIYSKLDGSCFFIGHKIISRKASSTFPSLREILGQRCDELLRHDAFYALCDEMGIIYGSILRGIDEIRVVPNGVLAKIKPAPLECVMDIALQPIFMLQRGITQTGEQVQVPYSVAYFSGHLCDAESAYSFIRKNVDETFDGIVYSSTGEVVFYFLGLKTTGSTSNSTKVLTDRAEQSNQQKSEVSHSTNSSKDQVLLFLRDVISTVLRIDAEKIKPYEDFSKLGMDSTLMVSIIETFELYCKFPIKGMPGTVFFEYKNLNEFTDYILNEHKEWVEHFIKEFSNDEQQNEETPCESHLSDKSPDVRVLVENYLRDVIATVLRIDAEKIKPYEDFSKLGMDSTLMVSIIETFELYCKFPIKGMPGTVFFEYKNLSEFVDYILNEHKEWVESFISQEFSEMIFSNEPENSATEGESSCDLPLSSNFSTDSECEGDIAVIGMYGQYGSCTDLNDFWDTLIEGRDAVSVVSDERKKLWGRGYEHCQYKGAWMKNIDTFSPLFYGITPVEAELMDPQERKFLDAVRCCIEESGYSPESFALQNQGKVGVYVGAMYGHYELFGKDNESDQKLPNSFFSTLANRVSYTFNFQGGSFALDSMCSSSLTALHIAKNLLRSGEINAAIIGGVNITSHPRKYEWLRQNSFLSATGQCTSYGEREKNDNGYVPGEGVGVVILKRLSDAQRDNDNILGIIKGSAINHVGHSIGYTVPDVDSQVRVIKDALHDANVDTSQISYIEGHGTGTVLGDPIEVSALAKVFVGRKDKLRLGSVKSNFGHLESASFVIALAKVLLQMRHGYLVPTIKCNTVNRKIDFAGFITLQKSVERWTDQNLTAGISSFGAGGSNGHVIVTNYVPHDQQLSNAGEKLPAYIICLSADTEIDLVCYIKSIAVWLSNREDVGEQFISSLSFILSQERSVGKVRVCAIVKDITELKIWLENVIRSNDTSDFVCSEAGSIHSSLRGVETYFRDSMNDSRKIDTAEYLDKLQIAKEIFLAGNKCPATCRIFRRLDVPTVPRSGEHYWINNLTADTYSLMRNNKLSAIQESHEYIDYNDYEFSVYNGELDIRSGKKCVLIFKEDLDVFSTIKVVQNFLKSNDYSNVCIVACVGEKSSPLFCALSNLLIGLSYEYTSLRVLEIKSSMYDVLLSNNMVTEHVRSVIQKVNLSVRQVEDVDGKLFIRVKEKMNIGYVKGDYLNKNGTYLVTGGMGYVGSLLIDHLIENGVRKLAIFGRRALDADIEDKLAELRSKGVSVFYDNPALDNPVSLRGSIMSIHDSMGMISGVFHLAGTVSNGEYSFINKKMDEFNRVCYPKISGLTNLYALLCNEVEFFILSSSISAANGKLAVGLSDYAFANSFMNSFAEKHSKCCSIMFPFIEGSKYSPSDQGVSKKDLGDIFTKIIGNKITGTVEVDINEKRVFDMMVNTEKNRNEGLFSRCCEYLIDMFSKALKIDKGILKNDTDFKKIGINSIVIADTLKKIESSFNINVNPSVVILNNSIEKLSNYLIDNFSAELTMKLS